jgi:hypothetical protein
MSKLLKIGFAVLVVWVAPFCLGIGIAQTVESNRIAIAYETPKTSRHVPILDSVRRHAVLERVQTLLSPIRLPRSLLFKTAGCDGDINAWFEDGAVTVCYEYIEYVLENAASRKRPAWVSEENAIVGSLIDVFLHEGAHALFDFLKIPILGREEDAADQVAAFMLLSLGRKDTPQLVAGIVYTYLNEAGVKDFGVLKRKRLRLLNGKEQADVHSLPLQRMYNTLCLAYGADKGLFEDAVQRGALPEERAEGCAEEFAQVNRAFRQLILPHIDHNILRQVLAEDSLSIKK